ncbi:MAG: hypothetical protein ACXWKT_20430 [Caulobacteraceae bacterium]
MSGPSRRAVAAGGLGAALAGRAAAQTAAPPSVQGLTTYSESAMVMSVSPDGRSAITLRFCRFPEVNLTWLWCHIVRDRRMWALIHHGLPCAPSRLADLPDADYRAPQMDAELARTGKGRELKAVRLAADLPFFEGAAAPLGPGTIRGRLSGLFTPTHALDSQVLKDRDEVYGTFSGEIAVAGLRWRHEGPAKFHEQRQTGPRFGPPFCYSWLGGPRVAATTLLIAQGAAGGWVFGDAEDALADMAVDPPGASRSVAYRLKSGRRLAGRLVALVRYQIPIYGRPWQGSFVRGTVDGDPVVGVMNDWTTPPDIYAAATTRNR